STVFRRWVWIVVADSMPRGTQRRPAPRVSTYLPKRSTTACSPSSTTKNPDTNQMAAATTTTRAMPALPGTGIPPPLPPLPPEPPPERPPPNFFRILRTTSSRSGGPDGPLPCPHGSLLPDPG